jgi:hypothetical protein
MRAGIQKIIKALQNNHSITEMTGNFFYKYSWKICN